MEFTVEEALLAGAVLLLISILASKSFSRMGVPALVMFLGVGMLAGSDGIGGIYFNDPHLAQSFGVVALTFILFAGGLDTKWVAVRPVLAQGAVLSTVGVFTTAFILWYAISLLPNFTLLEGLLLGSIVSSTDAAAVFSILRTKSIGLKGNLRPMLELESGSNDPMAYFLTILFTFLLVNPETSVIELVFMFFQQMILGALLGIGMGFALPWVINRVNLQNEGLYPVLTIALVLLTYAATAEVGGNGFLAVYIAGVLMGNRDFIHKRSLLRFYDGLSWLMQILMFLTLGLLVFPKDLIPVIPLGLIASAILILLARPLGVFLCLIPFKHSFREKLYISWVGLRGAVPIVFATYPLIAGAEKAHLIFNIVFFIVLTSVMLQGTTISVVAKWLKLAEKEPITLKHPTELEISEEMKNELFEIELPPKAPAAGKKIVHLGFPRNSLIVLINREGKYITPNGNTVLEPYDKLLIMTEGAEEIDNIHRSLGIA